MGLVEAGSGGGPRLLPQQGEHACGASGWFPLASDPSVVSKGGPGLQPQQGECACGASGWPLGVKNGREAVFGVSCTTWSFVSGMGSRTMAFDDSEN